MSRRKRRPAASAEAAQSREEGRPSGPRPAGQRSAVRRPTGARVPAPPSAEPRPARPRPSGRLAIDLAILATLFAATVGVAELAGAADLGVAVGVGQVTFALALVALLLRA